MRAWQRIRQSSPFEHRETLRQLPWLVNGTLSGGDRERAERHCATCPACRRERALQEGLAAAVARQSAPEVQPHPARLHKLLSRIEAEARPRRRHSFFGETVSVPRGVWLVVAAQALAVVVIGALLLLDHRSHQAVSAAPFRTLTAPEAAAPGTSSRLRVVFAPAVSAGEMRMILATVGARVVDGPTALGVYTVELIGEQGEPEAATVLDALRRRPEILFAEPLGVRR